MKERRHNNQFSSLDDGETVRPFASGSRQAPDPFDFYLDENGFYRKHTARDSSCLFRVISEQVYGIQNYHERVRAELVDYMRKNPRLFERYIKELGQDFDNYLMDMSKPKGHGGRQELRAAGLLYKANVIVFEPYMRGKYLVKHRKNFTRMIRVFFTAPCHYDSVYTKNYIEKAAFCQAVVYEILYERVFKLPDVKYAIERMLYDQEGKTVEDDEHKATTQDGREFIFDKADNTNCVLGDYKLCHFHNEAGFSAEIEKVKAKEEERSLAMKEEMMPRIFPTDYFLYESKISCVRQLLNASIAPFPYKVAKALDTSIYRNIEFDSWADWRREVKVKNWYYRGSQLMVGCKCFLRRFDANGEFYNICVIKDISKDKRDCLVFIEDTGESKFVPYASLKPLYTKFEESYHNVHNLSASRQYFATSTTTKSHTHQLSIKSYKHQETTFKCDIEIDQIGNNFQPYVPEIIAMPMIPKNSISSANDKPYVVLSGLPKKEKSTETNITFLQETDSLNDVNDLQKILQNNNNHNFVTPMRKDDSPKQPENLTLAETKINYNATKSEKIDGSDLPTDIATLRFFYNTGIESFKSSKAVGHIALQFSNLTTETTSNRPSPITPLCVSEMTKTFEKHLKTDDNNNTPANVATPLTANNSSSYQGNNNEYHNRRNIKRRSFHNNSNRGYHANNNGGNNNAYHGNGGNNYRNNLSYHNSQRHGANNNYHHSDYRHQDSFKGATTPTSVISQHSSIINPDPGLVTDNSQNNGSTSEYVNTQQNSVIEYSNNAVNVGNAVSQQQQQQQNPQQMQTPQYPQYVANVYQPQEYDQNNWYSTNVQTPYYYPPQANTVPPTPHLMIPAPADMNYSYMYNPNSAPVESVTTPMVESVYPSYVHPYYLGAPVQAPPMSYFTYYPPTPMGYSSGPAPATSPQVATPLAPIMSNMSNIQ
ncbi:uncharacterized protein LOC134833704 [Culicoides brevitarsis]|uniref:uncharacterized protein LOC134833704 n=1 Tax=Culicoides brevitarsis TaxID=469753 RepID=UPI00307B6349